MGKSKELKKVLGYEVPNSFTYLNAKGDRQYAQKGDMLVILPCGWYETVSKPVYEQMQAS